jgi:RNA polymerase sigma-70 factor, ECF subfamily
VTENVEHAFRAYWGDIVAFLRRRTRDEHRAEELAQQVFAEAAAGLRDDGRPPLAWLYTVARRRFADETRRQTAAARLRLPSRLEGYDSHVRGALLQGFAQLPESQRRVVLLKLVRGLPFAEVAARLDISEEAARMRFSRALRQLRTALEEEGVEP